MRPVIAALPLLTLIGCAGVTPPGRTLPDRIQSVYVAMPRNDSLEYGFEEELARHLHEELMADGRLRPVRQDLADARLDTTIQSFSRTPRSFNPDDYPIVEEATVTARVQLWEPGREETTVDLPAVTASTIFIGDPRRSVFTPEPEWRAQLMRNLAVQIVNQVLSPPSAEGEEAELPQPLRPTPVDVDLDTDTYIPTLDSGPRTF